MPGLVSSLAHWYMGPFCVSDVFLRPCMGALYVSTMGHIHFATNALQLRVVPSLGVELVVQSVDHIVASGLP